MTKKKAYFIGIGGIGVSALARYYLAQNWAVFGSDEEKSIITAGLVKDGVNVKIGHKKAHLSSGFDLVVKSQAIPATNPEVMEASRLGLKVLSYPEAVGALTREFKTVAIAGAHGKSTTTAMVAKILVDAGLDPMVIIGAKYNFFDGRNFRLGKKYLVLEADEFGRAFLNYAPAHLIILNIDREHLDTYKDLSDIKNTFLKLISRVSAGGSIVLNKDDKNILAIKKRIEMIAAKSRLKIVWFSYFDGIQKDIKKILPVPGIQNRTDAIAAYNLSLQLGISKNIILNSLSAYSGLWRRMEYKGVSFAGKALVFDDYAHHPTEIKASLSAFREKYPDSPIVCIFKPHQAQRLKILFKDFISSFIDADKIVILPTYIVSGRDVNEKVLTAKKLSQELKNKYSDKTVVYLADASKLRKTIESLLSAPHQSVVVMMGAGSIADLTQGIMERK